MDDLTTLTDTELDELRIAVQTERERREALATIPGQIIDLAARYVDGGGDPAALALPEA
ncbi:hypothetical protein [Microbacterium sp. KNMS]